jgi:signal transduction histidine kinase/ligand-binding sensor domain-containing protein
VLVVGLAFEPRVDAASQLDPTLAISQYAHTAWRIEDGAFGGMPNAIAQTTDGYLWIGTDAGIVRFDGVRFIAWTPPAETPVPMAPVYALKGTRDGSLWIGTGRGVARLNRDRLQTFPELVGRFNSFLEGGDGTVWAVRSRIGGTAVGALCHFMPSSGVRCFGQPDGIACQNANAVVADSSGSLWFGGSNALCRRSLIETQTSTYLERQLDFTGGLPGVTSLASASDGSVWVGLAQSHNGLGLMRVTERGATNYVVPGFDGRGIDIVALMVDADNSLWVGTRTNGVYRIRGAKAEHFGGADGLSSETVLALYQDREGSVWVATSRGLDRFRGFKVVSFSTRQGLEDDSVHSVVAARDGVIWIGTQGGLERLESGVVTMLSTAAGLPRKNTTSLFEDRAGRLWVGVGDGLALYDRGRFQSVQSGDDRPLGIVTAMTQDADGTIWAQVKGRRRALLHIGGLHVRETFDTATVPTASDVAADPHGGIWLALETGALGRFRNRNLETFPLSAKKPPMPRMLGVDPDGSVWVATSEGLFRWSNTVVKRLDHANGLPCDDLFAVLAEGIGGLWLYARCGVIRLSAADIDKWSAQSDAIVTPVVFDSRDGAVPAATTFRPAASRAPDGRVWFSNDAVAQMVDPHRPPGLVLPNVHVEQLVGDRRTYAIEGDVRLPALTRDVQLDYTATSLAIPDKVRFRYRLDGHDHEWQDAGTRRQAFYNDLGPGSYNFRVVASNADGIWNDQGASLHFTIVPAYFQTLLFRSSCLALFAVVLWASYELHLRRVSGGIADRMEAQLAERERIARELHDTVLQGAYGLILRFQAVVDRLPPSDPNRGIIEDTLGRAEQVIAEGRLRVDGLRTQSDDGCGLQAALAGVGRDCISANDTEVSVFTEGRAQPLHAIVRDEVYWIAREAIVNALRSAHAAKVEVELSYHNADLRVFIRDDGRGFEPAAIDPGTRNGHWGIRGMKERARRIGATVDIWTAVGAGTEVSLRIPASVAYRDRAIPLRRWWRQRPVSTARQDQ